MTGYRTRVRKRKGAQPAPETLTDPYAGLPLAIDSPLSGAGIIASLHEWADLPGEHLLRESDLSRGLWRMATGLRLLGMILPRPEHSPAGWPDQVWIGPAGMFAVELKVVRGGAVRMEPRQPEWARAFQTVQRLSGGAVTYAVRTQYDYGLPDPPHLTGPHRRTGRLILDLVRISTPPGRPAIRPSAFGLPEERP